jgi:hypothetical protein
MACINYIFSALLLFGVHKHPVHISILNLDYSNTKPDIELSFKIFTSDFELAIAHNYNIMLNLGKANENPEANKQIDKYFSYLFTIQINNNSPVKLVYAKKVTNEDATWFYFKIPVTGEVKELLVRNLLIMDIYEDQTNLMIMNINGKETGFRFDYKNREFKIKI